MVEGPATLPVTQTDDPWLGPTLVGVASSTDDRRGRQAVGVVVAPPSAVVAVTHALPMVPLLL